MRKLQGNLEKIGLSTCEAYEDRTFGFLAVRSGSSGLTYKISKVGNLHIIHIILNGGGRFVTYIDLNVSDRPKVGIVSFWSETNEDKVQVLPDNKLKIWLNTILHKFGDSATPERTLFTLIKLIESKGLPS